MSKIRGIDKVFRLSTDLSAVVGRNEATRAQVNQGLWQYIKKNNLQDPNQKQFFFPDEKMAKVFGKDRLRGFSMAKYVGAHFQGEVQK